MNTVFLLLAEFETGQIPLRNIAVKFLGMSEKEAKRRAGSQNLPFPVYRGSESQKGEWLVHAQDLATFIDTQRAKATEIWKKLNQAPNRLR